MRVLLAHSQYRTPGGEERHIGLLESALTSLGHDVLRFCPSVPPARARRVFLAGGLCYRPSAARSLGAVLKRERVDVVHFHNLLPMLTASALHAAHRSGARVVMTLHNYRFACPAGTLLRRGVRHTDCITGSSLVCGLRGSRGSRLEGAAYGLAIELQRRCRLLDRWVDAFVTPAAVVRDAFIRSGGDSSKIHVVANGVPIGPDNRDEGSHIFYAGRLSKEKGIGTLLRAAAELPETPFVVAGSGPLREDLFKAPSNVQYVGQLDGDDLAVLRRRAAVVVVPSEWDEVLPFAALEALADGRPLVATEIGGLRELLEKGVGVGVPAGDAGALARAVGDLWDDPPLRRDLGRRARDCATADFEVMQQTRRLIRHYEWQPCA